MTEAQNLTGNPPSPEMKALTTQLDTVPEGLDRTIPGSGPPHNTPKDPGTLVNVSVAEGRAHRTR